MAELLAGEVVSAAAQPLFADPGAEARAVVREQPMELADRDVAGAGGGVGGKCGIAQVCERVPFELVG